MKQGENDSRNRSELLSAAWLSHWAFPGVFVYEWAPGDHVFCPCFRVVEQTFQNLAVSSGSLSFGTCDFYTLSILEPVTHVPPSFCNAGCRRPVKASSPIYDFLPSPLCAVQERLLQHGTFLPGIGLGAV